MNNLLARLTEYDKKVMNRYIDLYAADDNLGRIKHKASIETIFQYWAENKEELSKMFPEGKLTIEEDIYYKKDSDQIYAEMDESDIISHFRDKMRSAWAKYCTSFGYSQSTLTWYNLADLICNSSLANNKYEYDSFTIGSVDKPVKICSGMKASRAIIKVAETIGMPAADIEEFRLEHSRLLNDVEVHGKMVFSIHPMDFMTMSDNDCRWHSCMSWTNSGEYRQGTVEMMNSPYIVEAYIASDKPYCFDDNDPSIMWNNKKWRELFIVSSRCIMGIKGYPYWSRDLEKIALAKLRTLATEKLGYHYEDSIREFNCEDDYSDPGTLFDADGNYYYFSTEFMYNDFRYTHYGYLAADDDIKVDINYSGPCQCMLCGDKWEIDNAEYLTCEHCHDVIYTCKKCGNEVDNVTYDQETGKQICWECQREKYAYDDFADTYIHIEDAALIEINYGNGITRKAYVRTDWLTNHWIDGMQELDDGQRIVIDWETWMKLYRTYRDEIYRVDEVSA